MHHPLAVSDDEGMVICDSQIVHHGTARHNPIARDHAVAAIGAQDVYPQFELRHRQEALLFGEERVFFVGMDDFARRCCNRAVRRVRLRGQRQIDEVGVR
ncbi:MAG: hypothetical protein WCD86_05395 [Ktedonobacteraceae bacterium]